MIQLKLILKTKFLKIPYSLGENEILQNLKDHFKILCTDSKNTAVARTYFGVFIHFRN